MAILLTNNTALRQSFGDVDVHIAGGVGQFVQIAVDQYLWSNDIQAAITASSVYIDTLALTAWEAEQIGLGGVVPPVPTDPNLHSDFTYDANDNVLTILTYATGAAGGDPAKLTTFTYDANDNVLTKETTDSVAP